MEPFKERSFAYGDLVPRMEFPHVLLLLSPDDEVTTLKSKDCHGGGVGGR